MGGVAAIAKRSSQRGQLYSGRITTVLVLATVTAGFGGWCYGYGAFWAARLTQHLPGTCAGWSWSQ